jgi:cytochrome c-type biogenesis protein CcmH/NrfG
MTRTFLPIVLLIALAGCGSPPAPPAEPEAGVASVSAGDPHVMAVLADFNRGNALMEQYRYGDAVDAYEKVVQAHPDWIAAQFNLGLAYLNLQGEREAKESLDVARQKFEQVLTLDANHAAALFSLGMYYQYMGETEQAVEYFQRAYQIDPEDLHVAYKLAEVLLALEHHDRGWSCWRKWSAGTLVSCPRSTGWRCSTATRNKAKKSCRCWIAFGNCKRPNCRAAASRCRPVTARRESTT